MDSVDNKIKNLLFEKIRIFKDEIKKIIIKDDKKNLLEEWFNNIWFWKILLFLSFISEQQYFLNKQILEFMEKFEIEKNEENYNIIKNQYDIFKEIKKIIF